MKKLTAGIFTVLLGLVSINSAEAAVASQGYVDAKFSSVGGDVSTLTQTVADNKAAAENALKTEKEAREAADTALDGRVTSAETAITTLNKESGEGSVAQSIADAIAGITASETAEAGSFISSVTQADGKVSIGTTEFKVQIVEDEKSTNAPTAAAVWNLVSDEVSNLQGGVTQELAGVKSTVNELTTTVSQNKTAAENAVNAEKEARELADTGLQNALNAEIAKREATDGVVSAMETAYKAADEALKTDLEGKIQTAAGSAGQVAADLAAYETKTDKAIADETAARVQGDADTLAAAKEDAASKDAALKTELEKYADQAELDAIATAGTNADTKISNLNLNDLSRVPADCAGANNYCVLTSNGSKYLWEVITRAGTETQPQGTDIPSVKNK